MPEPRYDEWVKTVFGIDPATYVTAADAGDDDAPMSANIVGDVASGLRTVGKTLANGVKAVVDVGAKAVEAGVKIVEDGVVSIASGSYEESMQRLDVQIKSVKDAGLDATPYEAQAKSIRGDYAVALKLPSLADRASAVSSLGKRAETAADQAKLDVARLKKSAVEGIGAAITDMRDGAKALIDKLPKDSADQPGLAKRLEQADKAIEVAGKLTDRAERAKTSKVLDKFVQALFDDAAKASKDKSTVNAVYGKALQDRYGFAIKNPAGMENTHLDQVYKMFGRVPEADVVQNRMRTLTYKPVNTKKDGSTVPNKGAAYGGATIEMGDYGREKWDYQDPKTGKTVKPNGFSITTLHELGHSVDDRFKIMSASRSKAGGGGWRNETAVSVAKAYFAKFRSGSGKGVALADAALLAAVQTALTGGGTARPAGTTDPDWAVVEPLLTTCAARRADAWPWGHPDTVDGRAYHQSYAERDEWWSYDSAVRAKPLTVRDYQWRAPGEWFAELYAYSYYYKKPPPGGIDAHVTAYMFGGSAAADPATA